MADHLSQDLPLPQREHLYTRLNKAQSSLRQNHESLIAKRRLADASDEEKATESDATDAKDEFAQPESRRTTLVKDFQKLSLFRRLYFYFLSIFSRKSAESIFRQVQLNEMRQEIYKFNNDLIVFDRNDKIYLVGPFLADRFNAVFRVTLEVLPIINQVDRNPKFMKDILLKLIFSGYNSAAEVPIQVDTGNFIKEDELRKHVFMGDGATTIKITELMEEVARGSKNLPLSLYKYGAKVLLALYQFQKICYFPFSSFFHTFRTDNMDQESMYSAVLPQSAYDSMNMLYQLIHEVGVIGLNKAQFQEIINSYVLVAGGKDNSKNTALDYMKSFMSLQNLWNTFIKQIPIDQLLFFTAEDPYLELPLTHETESEVIERLPREVEKVYQATVQEHIMASARTLRESRNKFFFKKYFSHTTFEYSKFYSNLRAELKPKKSMTDSEVAGPFAHCESFAYVHNFLRTFCNENLVRPMNVLTKGVFKSDNYVYNKVIDFLGMLETHKAKLRIIEQNLQPDHRLDLEIKSTLMRIEQRTEGAKTDYASLLMNLDREIRSIIEGLIKDMQDFAVHTIPVIESLIQDEVAHQQFSSFVTRFQFMHDYNNPAFTPLTPKKILSLWKQYIAEFTLLLHDQLELERQSILGKMSRIVNQKNAKKLSSKARS